MPLTFGQWMRQKREERGWRMIDCARRAKMTPQQWSDWENDRSRNKAGTPPHPSPKTVERVAMALEIQPGEALKAAFGEVSESAESESAATEIVAPPFHFIDQTTGEIWVGNSPLDSHRASYEELAAILRQQRQQNETWLDSRLSDMHKMLQRLLRERQQPGEETQE